MPLKDVLVLGSKWETPFTKSESIILIYVTANTRRINYN